MIDNHHMARHDVMHVDEPPRRSKTIGWACRHPQNLKIKYCSIPTCAEQQGGESAALRNFPPPFPTLPRPYPPAGTNAFLCVAFDRGESTVPRVRSLAFSLLTHLYICAYREVICTVYVVLCQSWLPLVCRVASQINRTFICTFNTPRAWRSR